MTPVTLEPLAVPLRQDSSGDIRVGDTRVLLDLVVQAWQNGDTPETIIQNYDTLKLADVYAVIAYYLAHKEQVESYMRQREQEMDALQRKCETEGLSIPWPEFRARILARRAQRGADHVAPDHR